MLECEKDKILRLVKKTAEKADKKLKGRKYRTEEQDNNNKTHIRGKIKRRVGNIIEDKQRKRVEESQEGM